MTIEHIGILGAGLMGRGIASTLLGFGFRVSVYSPGGEAELSSAIKQIEQDLKDMVACGLCSSDVVASWRDRYEASDSLDILAKSDFVIEAVIEDIHVKQSIYNRIEDIVGPSVTISSNSSAIPATVVQQGRQRPGRFVSMHGGEPAHNRFMEIIPGPQTDPRCVAEAAEIARRCKKDPSLLKKDIRGFITNRLMYSVFREAIHLLESGVADVEMIDRSFQNDVGSYSTIAGPFRLMDITGIAVYATVMKDLLPELSTYTQVPETMKRLVDEGANGIYNGRGFYDYTPEESEVWKRKWEEFGFDIRELADKYLPLDNSDESS